MTTDITTLDELSFVVRDDDDIRMYWQPTRGTHSPTAGMDYGRQCALRELAQLACVDEHDAHTAIAHALTSRAWNGDCAEEVGMADGLARLVIIGLRALAAEQEMPFSTLFDPQHAEWCSLHRRVDIYEAQFKSLKITPWRTYGQAGLG
jgi:hypothetical protein